MDNLHSFLFAKKRLISGIFGILFLLLISCSPNADYKGYAPATEDMELEASSEAMRVGNSLMKSDGAMSEAPMVSTDSSEATELPLPEDNERKRVYNGSAGLVVDDVEEIRRNIEELAVSTGGYVESSYAEYIIIRVPAEKFESVFEKILNSGRIDYSRVETLDITEAYADIARKLETAMETRNRLYVLLENSRDPQERARILREIGRLTEEIESLKQQTALMDSRIAFSRISVQLIPRIADIPSRQDIPFPWIANLDPMIPAGGKLRAQIEVDLGKDWAVFSREDVFTAENGMRQHLLISSLDNSPRGDSDFWQKALLHHLEPYYLSVVEKNISIGSTEIAGVELMSKDREPFLYFVGIVSDGRKLHVIEAFSPESKSGFSELYSSLAGGTLK